MTFDQFHNLLKASASMSAEKMVEFVVVKDLYNYIDSRADGHVDLSEWMEAFKKIEVIKIYSKIIISRCL